MYILFSSGTTGRPKCIVHGAAGILVNHAKELVLHGDMGPGDRLMYYTTSGWMMWNWQASALQAGVTLITVDGAVSHPDLNRLWALAEQEKVTHFGTSARFLAECRKAGLQPGQRFALDSLRLLFSTGSPLLPEDYDWVYGTLPEQVLLGSVAGGTDICGCFVGCCPLLPVRRGEISAGFWGWMRWPWTNKGGKPPVGASWCAGSRCRPCPWASGRMTTASVTGPPISIHFPASGPTAIMWPLPSRAAPSSTAAPTPPSTRGRAYRHRRDLSPGGAGSQYSGQPGGGSPHRRRRGSGIVGGGKRGVEPGSVQPVASAHSHRCQPPAHAPPHSTGAGDPLHPQRQKVELAVARLLNGEGRSDNKDALANPQALDAIAGCLQKAGLLKP
ncbi:AMP-binding protein [Oceanimonas sp. NS1]|nr:AMP-binding protein [Oceanimonas sp. NS1]